MSIGLVLGVVVLLNFLGQMLVHESYQVLPDFLVALAVFYLGFECDVGLDVVPVSQINSQALTQYDPS